MGNNTRGLTVAQREHSRLTLSRILNFVAMSNAKNRKDTVQVLFHRQRVREITVAIKHYEKEIENATGNE